MEVKKTMVVIKLKCNKCGYEWIPRVKNPIECPKCKSLYWNENKKKK
ncbi:MAG: hypothetical protein ACTSXD_05165 [Candidatus Heimdallarchaeaceae archaeon]